MSSTRSPIRGKLHGRSNSIVVCSADSRRAIEANRNYPPAYFNLAAALAQLGRLDEARSTARTLLALDPNFTISRARAAWTAMSDDPRCLAGVERQLYGLRKAGMPEE
jgi:Flp pilus assembly protein TadD